VRTTAGTPVSWLRTPLAGRTAFSDALGLRPELHEGYESFLRLFWQRRLVDPALLELCRLRVAAIHGCRSELARREPSAIDAGLSAVQVAAVLEDGDLNTLSDLEQACIRLTDKFILDVHAITDEDVETVRQNLGTAATVALVEALALFDGFSRFRALLGIDAGRQSVTDANPRGQST
jgi:alkylhydroperoxidase family enzyme